MEDMKTLLKRLRSGFPRKNSGLLALLLPLLVLSPVAFSQQAAKAKPAETTKAVKADSVTINMPEGMTKDQADAILNELRQIRQLLEKQQTAAVVPSPAPPPAPEKVSMSIGKGWYSIGSETAPVTMIEFADYQCPFCKAFHTATFADLKKNYVDTGKVRFVTRDLPLDFHQNALRAAEAARCAGDQGRFWEMRNALITNSTDLSQEAVERYAKALAVEMGTFAKCVDGEQHKADIQKDQADAGALQITGTPSFVIGRMKNDKVEGVKLVGAMPYATFDSKIKDLLATQP